MQSRIYYPYFFQHRIFIERIRYPCMDIVVLGPAISNLIRGSNFIFYTSKIVCHCGNPVCAAKNLFLSQDAFAYIGIFPWNATLVRLNKIKNCKICMKTNVFGINAYEQCNHFCVCQDCILPLYILVILCF